MSAALAGPAPAISNHELRAVLGGRAIHGRPSWLDPRARPLVAINPMAATPAGLLALISSLPFQGGLSGKHDHLDVLLHSRVLTRSDGRTWRAGLAVDRVGKGTLSAPQPVYRTFVAWQNSQQVKVQYRIIAASNPAEEHRDLEGHLLAGANLQIASKRNSGFDGTLGSNPVELTLDGVRAAVAVRLSDATGTPTPANTP